MYFSLPVYLLYTHLPVLLQTRATSWKDAGRHETVKGMKQSKKKEIQGRRDCLIEIEEI